MDDFAWILIDTETTGFQQPIYTVELAAQKMRGWEREGGSFRRLLNQNQSIPSEASRVHGYTAEILERDGDLPGKVYRDFGGYAEGLPVVAYNLSYDWDDVLVREWKRLGIPQIGERGFCAYLLAQRLLDPVPAGNCKLQTLRQYYRLPERGAHTAMGDVDTVIDLMQTVLRPIAKARGLKSWEQIIGYTQEEWYPSRLPFGKFKGRPFFDANEDQELRSWLSWLAESSNQKSSRMGKWYIDHLESGKAVEEVVFPSADKGAPGMVIYQHPELKQYRTLVEAARSRLAELELEYGIEKAKVDSIRSRLFESLRSYYQERDRVRLVIQYRNAFIDALLSEGEESAEKTTGAYERASSEQEEEYDSIASALEGKRELNHEEAAKLKMLWKKLVRMFHPDQYEQDPEKRQTYELLTQAINAARDRGDIELLELIAKDPQAFILAQGWVSVPLDDLDGVRELRSLYEVLQVRILEVIESLEELRASPDFELFQFAEKDEAVIDRVIEEQRIQLEKNLEELKLEADKKAAEIEELTGNAPF
jgi:DNA polymerase-3 subunit epsilon